MENLLKILFLNMERYSLFYMTKLVIGVLVNILLIYVQDF